MNNKNTEDFAIIKELKALWVQYGHIPEVSNAFKMALSDGHLSIPELNNIKLQIQNVVLKKYGGLEVFRQKEQNVQLVEEIDDMIQIATPGSDLAKMLELALSDGDINKKELELLRAERQRQMIENSMGPSVRVNMPRPPKLDTPGRVKKTEEDEEE